VGLFDVFPPSLGFKSRLFGTRHHKVTHIILLLYYFTCDHIIIIRWRLADFTSMKIRRGFRTRACNERIYTVEYIIPPPRDDYVTRYLDDPVYIYIIYNIINAPVLGGGRNCCNRYRCIYIPTVLQEKRNTNTIYVGNYIYI